MKEKRNLIIGGLAIGIISVVLVLLGNPANMGFCIACFLRDTAGALKLHSAGVVQYLRPEIIGLVLGACITALIFREFRPRGGSSPFTRFILGFCVMIGALLFLGCPFRMILRLAGGDMNALIGLVGFIAGIGVGVFFLSKGFSLGKSYVQPKLEGFAFPVIQLLMLVLLTAGATLIVFSESGPGSMHAPVFASLAAGLAVGAIGQRTRLCMAGGIRDVMLFRDWTLLCGFVAILIAALAMNAVTGKVNFGFEGQPVAHTDGAWNFLGMLIVGFGSVLLGGCPLRQLVMAGEGSGDSVVTVMGLTAGAAFCHNFGLASSGEGTTANGRAAGVAVIVVLLVIAAANTFFKKETREND